MVKYWLNIIIYSKLYSGKPYFDVFYLLYRILHSKQYVILIRILNLFSFQEHFFFQLASVSVSFYSSVAQNASWGVVGGSGYLRDEWLSEIPYQSEIFIPFSGVNLSFFFFFFFLMSMEGGGSC